MSLLHFLFMCDVQCALWLSSYSAFSVPFRRKNSMVDNDVVMSFIFPLKKNRNAIMRSQMRIKCNIIMYLYMRWPLQHLSFFLLLLFSLAFRYTVLATVTLISSQNQMEKMCCLLKRHYYRHRKSFSPAQHRARLLQNETMRKKILPNTHVLFIISGSKYISGKYVTYYINEKCQFRLIFAIWCCQFGVTRN